MKISIRGFRGTMPGLSKRLLPDNMAEVALNCNLQSGEIRPFRSLLRVNTPTKIGTKKTIYRWLSRTNQDANGTITNATQANPVVIESAGHGRATGERIYVSGVVGMTQINHRTFTVTVVDPDHFSLDGEDGTAYPAYAGGGTWVKENGFWFHWVEDVDVARSPIAGDTQERTVFTGDDVPKVTDATIATAGGGTDYPTNSFQLGIPKPDTEPTTRAVRLEASVLDLFPGDIYDTGELTAELRGDDFTPVLLGVVPRLSVRERAVVVTDDILGLKSGERANFSGVVGAGFVNDRSFEATVIDGRVINALRSNPVVLTIDEDLPVHRYSGGALFDDGDKIKIDDIGGIVQLNGNVYQATLIKKDVTGSTQDEFFTTPIDLTVPGHGLVTGDRVAWAPGTWVREEDGVRYIPVSLSWTVRVLDADRVRLNNSTLVAAGIVARFTTTVGSTYSGGGKLIPLRQFEINVDGTGFDEFKYPGKWKVVNKFLLEDTEGMGASASMHGLTKKVDGKARVFNRAHQFASGDRVAIKVLGAEDLGSLFVSGPYGVTKVDENSFELEGSEAEDWTSAISFNSNRSVGLITHTWSGGGTWTRQFRATEVVARSYVYTFVSVLGEEGPPSDPSEILEIGIGQTTELTNIAPVPGGDFNITAKRIYRTDPGLTGADFRFVAEVPAASTDYTDTVEDEKLGGAILSEEWIAPPLDLRSIHAMENGILVGVAKNDIYFTEPYLPHAWPGVYRKTLPHNAIAVRAAGNTAVALTEHGAVLVTGNHPSQMADRDLKLNQVCVSKRGAAAVGTSGVVYPSPDGLVLVGISGHSIVTEGHLTRDEWQTLNPSSIIGTVWEDRYIGFFTRKDGSQGGFIFDPRRPEVGLTFIDTTATAVFNDAVSDTLYLQVGDHIEAWDRGGLLLRFTWKSKEYETQRRTVFAVAQVIAVDYSDLTFNQYRDGVLAHSHVVTSEKPFRLPIGLKGRRWQLEVTGTSHVQEILMAESPLELG